MAFPVGSDHILSSAGTEGQVGRRRYELVAVVAVVVLAADQLTKWLAVRELADGPVEWGPIRLVLSHNRGAAFGLGSGFVPLVALAAVALVVVLLVLGRGATTAWQATATGLVLGGAIGNLVDRLFREPGLLRGAVVDFVDLRWWPVFNLADSAITVGCVLLVLLSRPRAPSGG